MVLDHAQVVAANGVQLLGKRRLVQAVAFAKAKGKAVILEDISSVLGKPLDELTVHARSKPLAAYMLLSREVLAAAGWVKRYAQALLKEEEGAGKND